METLQIAEFVLPATRRPEGYFEEVEIAFEKAVSNSADIRRYYRLGSEVLCLRFAGEALLKSLSMAFSHLELPPCLPSLTINCWDCDSTDTPMPPPPWLMTAYGPRGHIQGFNNEVIRTVYNPDNSILHMYNNRRRLGIYWMQHPRILPYWEMSFPMRCIIHWWSKLRPFQLVHAGAVGFDKGGILLTGKSGSGKSTTALSCVRSGLKYVGDDYVMISNEPIPFVYSLYNTGKLVPNSVNMLPHLSEKISNKESLSSEKALFFLNEHFPEKLSAGFPIKAIFLPRVTHQKNSRIRQASSAESLLALAPTTVLHLEGDGKIAFDKMRLLTTSVPNFWLDLGTDVEQIPYLIADFLERSNG
ncbi:MAG: hypothetical protein WCG42_00070 [Parachlamydiaceae bacterium]